MTQLWNAILEALDRADALLDGRLWIAGLGAVLLLVALVLPRRRAGGLRAPWPGLWACGAVGTLAAVALILR
jgi:hypothetical protein